MFNPQLPTDNLYKFLAIAGLVTLVASMFLPMQYVDKANSEIYQIAVKRYELYQGIGELDDPEWFRVSSMDEADYFSPEWVENSEERDRWLIQFSFLEFRLNKWINMEGQINDNKDKDDWLAVKSIRLRIMLDKDFTAGQYAEWAKSLSLKEFQAMMRLKIERAKTLLPILYRQRQAANRIWDLIRRRDQYEIVSFVGMMIGFASIGLGFSMWYIKLQRHQDELLLLELAAKKGSGIEQKQSVVNLNKS